MERDESIEWWLKAWYAEPKEESEIEVGDEVKVTHNSCCYTRYADWVTDNVSDVCDRLRYDYANLPSNGDIKEKQKVLRVQDWYSLIGVAMNIIMGLNRNGLLTGQK